MPDFRTDDRVRISPTSGEFGGLSLGAGIATRFTRLYPARVRSLLVTNSSSAAGLLLSADTLAMRARSIQITLGEGMDGASRPSAPSLVALDFLAGVDGKSRRRHGRERV